MSHASNASQSPSYKIIFHGNCIDGWFSAYIAHLALTRQGVTDIKMYPAAPTGAGLPSLKEMVNAHILLVDISFDASVRATWVGALSVNCIDHHATSADHWPAGTIHTECCAAMLTFRHFFPQQEVPYWLHIIDRVDRWDNPTYEDRCIREVLTGIAHKPIHNKKNMAPVIAETTLWITTMDAEGGYQKMVLLGKPILDQKDAHLCQILTKGTFLTLGFEHAEQWHLPNTWLGANVYIIDNTHITFDTTEASHMVFTNYPGVDIFINYRQKTFLTKGEMETEKSVIVYSARSRGFNVTEGTIFKGHPTAAGASLVKGEVPVLPFLLTAV
jgi:hypothetical protein